ncbi:MAG: SIMPL domain-containing protein [Mycolicibacterium cosmeticum]|nr:SIMPL domain-containing protein [Mycolicibacterium cosmeticum]
MPLAHRAPVRICLAAIAAALALGVTACDSTPPSPKSSDASATRQVTVVGSGKVQGTPDTLTVSASMEATAPDITAALNQTSQRQQAVINALGGAGIDKKDISTSQVSLQPQYNIDGSTISGYRASNSIDVKIRKIDTASNILALITNNGGDATRINSVTYSIEDDSQLVKDARARAFNDAKDRADQYAQLSGLSLGKVISISEVSGSPGPNPPTPTPMPRAAMAEAVPLEPGQQTVGFSVTVVWELT